MHSRCKGKKPAFLPIPSPTQNTSNSPPISISSFFFLLDKCLLEDKSLLSNTFIWLTFSHLLPVSKPCLPAPKHFLETFIHSFIQLHIILTRTRLTNTVRVQLYSSKTSHSPNTNYARMHHEHILYMSSVNTYIFQFFLFYMVMNVTALISIICTELA